MTDTCIPEDKAFRAIEKHVLDLWVRADQQKKRYFPHEIMYQLLLEGRVRDSYQIDPAGSWLLAAAEKNLPIFVPGWEDSTLGNIFVSHVISGQLSNFQIVKSGLETMEALARWYVQTTMGKTLEELPEVEASGDHDNVHMRAIPKAKARATVGFFQIGGGIAGRLPDLRRADDPPGPAPAVSVLGLLLPDQRLDDELRLVQRRVPDREDHLGQARREHAHVPDRVRRHDRRPARVRVAARLVAITAGCCAMSHDPFAGIPAPRRDAARNAVAAALGSTPVTALRPVSGGASALIYRVETDVRPYLLRVEAGPNALQNPDHYVAMNAAVEAGIAPKVLFASPEQGVAVMDFVSQRPLQDYPGGPPALVRELGGLLRRLQDSTDFPTPPIRYVDLIRRMLTFLRGSRVFAAGLLDPHVEGFERIAEAYPWNYGARVSSHNDPNPRNILFDGDRLWLIDWETAYRNDPLTDLAVVTHELAATPELANELLRSWLGGAPDSETSARLVLMQQVTRMFFVCLIFRHFAADPNRKPDSDLTALTGDEFVAAIQRGQLRIGTPELLYAWGKMYLAGFRYGLTAPGFEEALAAVRNG